MRLLADQDVFAATVRFLAALGHDVVPVAQLGLERADDEDLLRLANEQERLFLTRDRDFGALVFLEGISAGVLYLRMLPSTQALVHGQLQRVLTSYSEEELLRAFVVVEAHGHRIRRLPADDG